MPSLSALLQKLLLSLTFALFANTASAMFIQPDWLEPTEPGVGTNRYAYSGNDPINKRDRGGNAAETIWDVASASIGYHSAYNNFANGNLGAGIVDLGGAFLDTAAAVIPVVPGGASYGIQGVRGLGRPKKSPCNSFAGHTLIQTKDGLVPIEAVAPGDLVFSREEYGTAQAYNRVLTVFKNEHADYYKLLVSFDGEHQEIDVTDEHPFFVVDKGWREAAFLRPGDFIETATGKTSRVEEISEVSGPLTAFNLEVENFPTYYVSPFGLLVHNENNGGFWANLFGGNKNSNSVGPAQSHSENRDIAKEHGLNGKDGMQSHHIPGQASVNEYLKRNDIRLTKSQRLQLRDELGAVLLSKGNHLETRTWGGRNAKLKTLDADNLISAVDKDVDDLVAKFGISGEQADTLKRDLKEHIRATTAKFGAPC